MWVRPDSNPLHDHIPRGALTLGHAWEERHVSPFRLLCHKRGLSWVLRFHMRLFRGPSQLDGLVPPRDGDDLQMLGGGLYQSLQHGPGGHLSSFSVLICKTGITQQHTEISWRTWTIRCQNIFIKYLRQGDTGTWRKKKNSSVKCSWQFKAIIRNLWKRRTNSATIASVAEDDKGNSSTANGG